MCEFIITINLESFLVFVRQFQLIFLGEIASQKYYRALSPLQSARRSRQRQRCGVDPTDRRKSCAQSRNTMRPARRPRWDGRFGRRAATDAPGSSPFAALCSGCRRAGACRPGQT